VDSDPKDKPDVTVLMPCLNERAALPCAVESARAALAELNREGLAGEVLVSDNGSTDGSAELAAELGCRVTHCAKRGYGNALIVGLGEARGRFIIMGDADGSYDFLDAVPMVARLRDGYDLCTGNRFAGGVEPGAMPWKNRVIGNPVLSGILNLFYRSGIHDAHCGLRALTKEAFERMSLDSPGMEFASEMVVKASMMGLRRTEVPVTLHKARRDRPPHLRPWRDGWRHLRFLLMFSPLWLYFLPSALLVLASSAVFVLLLATPPGHVFSLGPFWIGDHWMILAGGVFYVGYSGILLGIVSLVHSVSQGYRRLTPLVTRVYRLTSLENAGLVGVVLCVAATAVFAHVFVAWSGTDFGPLSMTREMVVGTTLLATGVETVFVGFLLSLVRGPD
jgi:hypothetical protein